MKESITKFDLEAAFKALDEIDAPKAGSLKANRPALTEIFSRKTKFDALMEEYYDVGNMEELGDAKETREAEVAQAKLARIEKIVDLDAESPEDLLPSYVGKFIMQCPQCMTLFYKNPEDVEASEEDPAVVNVQEVCQHCGNESGYTLIGKVGEATDEEMSDYTREETVDVTSTDEDEEELPVDDELTAEESEEELDLELDELDLDLEDDEAEKAEESFNNHSGDTLVEDLHEDADEVDVSADEFEKLISSPEFKKPVSDAEARAMMDEVEGKKEDTNESALTEAVLDLDSPVADSIYDMFNSCKFIHNRMWEKPPKTKKISDDTYLVTHRDGGDPLTVKFDISNPDDLTLKFSINGKKCETRNTIEAQDFILKELDAARIRSFDLAVDEALEEGIFDKLKDKFATIGNTLKSRDKKADWVLANAMKSYNSVKVDSNGKPIVDDANRKFKTYVTMGFGSKTAENGKPGVDKSSIKYFDTYVKADGAAKGWSLANGNAFIYFAESRADKKPQFICEYEKGRLKPNDKLGQLFKEVTTGIKGAKLMAAAEENVESEPNIDMPNADDADNTEITAAELKPGMKFEVNGEKVEFVKRGKLKTTSGADSTATIIVKKADGKHAILAAPTATEKIQVVNEGLNEVLDELDELQESSLEKLISDSLVESYGNVAGFRLAECIYADNKFAVNGTIYFTSGNKRTTSYVFTEAMKSSGKVSLCGLNEKLGNDKQFTITGYTDNKTFITESFKATKK